MSKAPSKSGKKLSAKNIAAGFLMALLAISLLGFGVEGFGGRTTSIGTVGGRSISTNDYARALQNELRAFQAQTGQAISMEQARLFGLDRSVLEQLVTTTVLDNEAERLGISVGDETVQREILGVSAFQGLSGQFDREAYRFALQSAGLSETEFERSIREDVARTILQLAAISATRAPAQLIDPILAHQTQTRDISVVTLGAGDLDAPIGSPDMAELAAFHQDNLDRYTQPEGKRIRYAWLTPDMLIDTLDIDEATLRDAYEARSAEFRQPERRLVDRLVMPDMAAAEDALERLRSGAASFADIVTERGLTLEDTDMGDVSRAQLGTAADAVFDLTEPGFAGPVQTNLGPAIFRMNAILAARETPFEQAAPDLRAELLSDRARRVLADDLDLFEDLLAGGASVAELAQETEMQGGEIDWRPGVSDGIAAYDSFRQAARALQSNDFPVIEILEDGGLFALELIEVLPAAPRPLEEIRTQVTADWRNARIVDALEAQARELASQMRSTALVDLPELAAERIEGLRRTDFLPDLPRDLVGLAFDMDPQEVRIFPTERQVHILKLHAVQSPDPLMQDIARMRDALEMQLDQSIAQDLFTYFSAALRQSQPIQLDQRVIDAVQANF